MQINGIPKGWKLGYKCLSQRNKKLYSDLIEPIEGGVRYIQGCITKPKNLCGPLGVYKSKPSDIWYVTDMYVCMLI